MYKIVVVRWIDAAYVEHDIYEGELLKQKPLKFTTAGLMVSEDANKMVLASTVGRDEDGTFYRNSLILPKKIIVETIVMPFTIMAG